MNQSFLPSFQGQQYAQQQQFMQPQFMQQLPVMQQPQQNVPKNNWPTIYRDIFLVSLLLFVIWLINRKNGKFSEWSKYTECSKTCGGGTQTRTRTYEPAKYEGKDLPDKDNLKETQKCNEAPCKINGKMSDWKDTNGTCQISETNPIQISCGTGKKQQTRSYISASNGGIDLDKNDPERLKLSQWTECTLDPCPNADGSFTDWKYTGNCVSDQVALTPKTCGDGGTQKQTRTYTPPKGTGKDLPDKTVLTKWTTCENVLPPCPARTDGSCTAWRDEGVCDCSTTGVNQKKQTRIYTAPANGGNPAPAGCDSTVTRNVACPEPCPKDPVIVDFVPQPDDKCSPQTGRVRERPSIGKYTFPVGKPHSQFIAINFTPIQIDDIKKLEYDKSQMFKGTVEGNVTFTRINNTIPEEYIISKLIKCDPRSKYTEDQINAIWKLNTICEKDLSNDIFNVINSSFNELQYIENDTNIISKFNLFTKRSMLDNYNTKNNYYNIKNCRNTWIDVLPTDNYVPSDTLVAALRFPLNSIILRNNGFYLSFQSDGNLVLYNKNNEPLWNSNTQNRTPAVTTVGLEWSGNFVIRTSNDITSWHTDTGGQDGNVLQLNSVGDLYIINPSNNIKTHYLYQNIRNYLENAFYNNSPNAVFSDKKGRFFKFKWSDYDNGRVIDQIGSETGANNYIRGKYMNDDNSEWDVNELDLVNISGYDSPITGGNDNKPNKGDPRDDNNGDNYNTEQDRKNFYGDSGDKTGMILGPKIRKPLIFPTGGMSKSNYLPGYIRRSIVDCNEEACSHKFLVMNRSGRNQAFVVYQKYHDRATFANDIMGNHPDLIAKIKKDFNTIQR